MPEVDFIATRCSDGAISIDRAPSLIHVTPGLLAELDLADGIYWTVGTEGRGAGEATYRLTDDVVDAHGTRTMERVALRG